MAWCLFEFCLPLIAAIVWFMMEQEPTGCHRCILWLWKPQRQHAIHVLRRRCYNRRGRVCSSRYIVHKNLENTKHGYVPQDRHTLFNKVAFNSCCNTDVFSFCFNCRCRVMATRSLSQVHRWGSVWTCKCSYGEVSRSTGNLRCECADEKSH